MSKYPTTHKEALEYKYSYWKNKPVKKLDEVRHKSGKLEKLENRVLYSSPNPIEVKGLEWKTVDLNNTEELQKVTDFINDNFTTDAKDKFKPYYDPEYIKWLFGLQGELLTLKYGSLIVGTIGYIVRNMIVESHKDKFGEVKFLCVHSKYQTNSKKNKKQSKKLVHVLMDEIVRRLVNKNITSGVFTTERYVPTPTATIRHFYRPLNYAKLLDLKHTVLVGDKDSIHRRFMETLEPHDYYVNATEENIDDIYELYNEYVSRFNVYVKYTKEELKYYLFNPYVRTYVMKSKDGKIVDFTSYYLTKQSVNKSKEVIKEANLFLYSCNREDVNLLASNTIRLVTRDTDSDIFNATDHMNNSEFLLSNKFYADEDSDEEDYSKSYDHKFLKDSQKHNLNFFNFATSRMSNSQVCWSLL